MKNSYPSNKNIPSSKIRPSTKGKYKEDSNNDRRYGLVGNIKFDSIVSQTFDLYELYNDTSIELGVPTLDIQHVEFQETYGLIVKEYYKYIYEMIGSGEFIEKLQSLFEKLYDNVDFSKEEDMDKYMMCFLYVIDNVILMQIIGSFEDEKNKYICAYKDLELDCLDKRYLKEHLIEKYTNMLEFFLEPLPYPPKDNKVELENYKHLMVFTETESRQLNKALDILRN